MNDFKVLWELVRSPPSFTNKLNEDESSLELTILLTKGKSSSEKFVYNCNYNYKPMKLLK